MSDVKLLSFALTSLIIELTPGPNMAFLAVLALSRGPRIGLAAIAGIALGLSVYGVVAALGLTAAFEAFPLLYEILRWSGVAYLLWLAWESWAAEAEVSAEAVGDFDSAIRQAFMRGLITNLLNPKAGVFYVAVLPVFVVPHAPVLPQTLTLTAIYVTIATVIHAAIVLLASQVFARVSDAGARRKLRKMMALALVVVAVWLAVATDR